MASAVQARMFWQRTCAASVVSQRTTLARTAWPQLERIGKRTIGITRRTMCGTPSPSTGRARKVVIALSVGSAIAVAAPLAYWMLRAINAPKPSWASSLEGHWAARDADGAISYLRFNRWGMAKFEKGGAAGGTGRYHQGPVSWNVASSRHLDVFTCEIEPLIPGLGSAVVLDINSPPTLSPSGGSMVMTVNNLTYRKLPPQ